jgi:phosphatidylserine/phosphatidylglycerophosphate/cardiolipin synthase-like enzyme
LSQRSLLLPKAHMGKWKTQLLTLLWSFALFCFASPVVAKDAPETFTYKLYTADIFPWISGERAGRVLDTKGHMATQLQRTIAGAERYLDIAVYGVDKQQWFLDVLGHMSDNGVRVRVVVDQLGGRLGEWIPENFAYDGTIQLPRILPPGHVLPDVGPTEVPRAGTIMHNKFLVVDRRFLWVGSTNFSHTGIGGEYNANSSLLIDSPEIARIYANEFYQMFAKHRFSLYKSPRAQRRPITFGDGTEVSIYFSPQDNALEAAILPFIASAETSLYIAMFYLTDVRVANALKNAVSRGVRVKLIYDALAAAHSSSQHEFLRDSGVEVKIENWGGKMHMKSAIADGKHVLTGSMNWSDSGSNGNDENTIIIKDNPTLAGQMTDYFNRLWRTLSTNSSAPRSEGRYSINSCFDGLDNDHDGDIDAADTGCR